MCKVLKISIFYIIKVVEVDFRGVIHCEDMKFYIIL